MQKFKIEILTPVGLVYEGDCRYAEFPGAEGVFGVLPRHTSMISNLAEGLIKIDDRQFSISEGVVEIVSNQCQVLVSKVVQQ